jgi:hypothetical protein
MHLNCVAEIHSCHPATKTVDKSENIQVYSGVTSKTKLRKVFIIMEIDDSAGREISKSNKQAYSA